jgi:hypothetical protein
VADYFEHGNELFWFHKRQGIWLDEWLLASNGERGNMKLVWWEKLTDRHMETYISL